MTPPDMCTLECLDIGDCDGDGDPSKLAEEVGAGGGGPEVRSCGRRLCANGWKPGCCCE